MSMRNVIFGLSVVASVTTMAYAENNVQILKEKIEKSMPGLTIDSLKESPISGVYELVSAGDVAYVSGDGEHMIQGTLYNVPTKKNLTDKTLASLRKDYVKELDKTPLLIYPAKGKALHTITVFTDPSCPYCHRMNEEMQTYADAGITIRYALYARMGSNNNTSRQLQEIICAQDPKSALNIFFKASNRPSEGGDCKKVEGLNKIASLAPKLGLEGTPHIVMSNGVAFSGYQPAQELLKTLDRNAKE